MSEQIEVTAAIERLSGVTAAFIEDPSLVKFLDSMPAMIEPGIRTMLSLSFQMGYMKGHGDGMEKVNRSVGAKVADLLKQFD